MSQEGKFTLGLIYAMDRDLTRLKGNDQWGINFISYLKRWIENQSWDIISTPFTMGFQILVHWWAEEVSVHISVVSDYFTTARNHLKKTTLDLFESWKSQDTNSQIGDIANRIHVCGFSDFRIRGLKPSDYFKKTHRAVTPSKCQPIPHTKKSLRFGSWNSLKVHFSSWFHLQITDQRYPKWSCYLETDYWPYDKTMEWEPLKNGPHRYKFGNKSLSSIKTGWFTIATIVQGPLLEIQKFQGQRSFYVLVSQSEKPGWSEELSAPEWDSHYSEEERMEVSKKSWLKSQLRIPRLKTRKSIPQLKTSVPVGGVGSIPWQ